MSITDESGIDVREESRDILCGDSRLRDSYRRTHLFLLVIVNLLPVECDCGLCVVEESNCARELVRLVKLQAERPKLVDNPPKLGA
jgi:hypothetical protein